VIVGSRFSRASRSDLQRCADRFDSFDWDTGTIENEDGEREICPYLE
jgi:BA14K-like protein